MILPTPRARRAGSERGYTLVEVLFVAALSATAGAAALPNFLAALDDVRTRGAVRYVVSRLQLARMEAVSRSADTALVFTGSGGSFRYAQYLDGNRNGVLSADIARGIDPMVRPGERLADQFPRVDFGALPGLPPVEPGTTPPGDDPIRLGAADMVTFTPLGTSTPGSLYVLGPRRIQYVVRIFGTTGRTRILKFDRRSGLWKPL